MSNPVPHSKKSLRLLLVAPKGRKDSKSNHKPLFNMALGVLVSLTPEHHHIEIIDEHFGDTVEFQHKFMTSYYKAYAWKNIANRVRRNPYKLLNLITSLAFRKNLREQLDTFEELHHIKERR
ncbi:hypothetical protein [Chlorobium sp. KB01]|uniref:hypothetical protein n=1 Tax=Chlorobium sp. KB01 TaxID=1917528 RepID=UPI0009763353|nr:hypothetical protein [Chlorobium sp. KB01]